LSAALVIVNELAAKDDSRAKVKVSAAVGKIDAAGKQTITITFEVVKDWHIYANPVKNETFESIATEVQIYVGGKLATAKIQYPAGKLHKDPKLPSLDCMVYEGKVEIQAVLQRTPGDVSPLDIDVRFSACDAKNCLNQAELKLTKENNFSHVPKK
jgi:hypothetical protein